MSAFTCHFIRAISVGVNPAHIYVVVLTVEQANLQHQ